MTQPTHAAQGCAPRCRIGGRAGRGLPPFGWGGRRRRHRHPHPHPRLRAADVTAGAASGGFVRPCARRRWVRRRGRGRGGRERCGPSRAPRPSRRFGSVCASTPCRTTLTMTPRRPLRRRRSSARTPALTSSRLTRRSAAPAPPPPSPSQAPGRYGELFFFEKQYGELRPTGQCSF